MMLSLCRRTFSRLSVGLISNNSPMIASGGTSTFNRFAHSRRRRNNKNNKTRENNLSKWREIDDSTTMSGLEANIDYSHDELDPRRNMLDRILNDLQKNGTTYIIPSKESEARLSIIEMIERLLSYGVRPEFIVDAAGRNAKLFRCFVQEPVQSLKILEVLVNNGYLTFEDAIRFLALFPDELRECGPAGILSRLESIASCGVSNARQTSSMLRRLPLICFSRTPEDMRRTAESMAAFFTRKEVAGLIVKCPQILLKNIDEIEQKYEYMFYQMGLESDDVAASIGWIDELTLDEIENRHELLKMTGKYTMPDAKKPQIRRNNPNTMRIFDTTDEEFAMNVARISMEEWTVFNGLRLKMKEASRKDRPFERVKPSKRKAVERRHKSAQRLDEHVFDASAVSAN